jgi:hypothetical protein
MGVAYFRDDFVIYVKKLTYYVETFRTERLYEVGCQIMSLEVYLSLKKLKLNSRLRFHALIAKRMLN